MLARSPDKRSSRWLLPREHGAYAELLFPLVTVFCLGNTTLASVALSLAILAGFLAHEPLKILLGARGGALQRELRGRARVQGVLLLTVSIAAGALGLCRSGGATIGAALGLLPALALVLGLTLTGRDKSLLGETVVSLLLAFAALPVALAAGLSPRVALCSALTWSAVFVVGTATVHALLARKKRGVLAPSRAVIGMALALTSGAMFSALSGRGSWPLAAVPMAVIAVVALLLGVPPRRLRVLGWAMVLAHVGAGVGLRLSLGGPCAGARRVPNCAVVGTERGPVAVMLQRGPSHGIGLCPTHAVAVPASRCFAALGPGDDACCGLRKALAAPSPPTPGAPQLTVMT